jgi:hypothetical protein
MALSGSVWSPIIFWNRMQRRKIWRMTRYLLVHVSSSTDVKDNTKTLPGRGMESCISSDCAM